MTRRNRSGRFFMATDDDDDDDDEDVDDNDDDEPLGPSVRRFLLIGGIFAFFFFKCPFFPKFPCLIIRTYESLRIISDEDTIGFISFLGQHPCIHLWIHL